MNCYEKSAMKGIFDTQFSLLQKSLDLRSQRNTLLSSNVANMETPGYKARDMVFENALGDALAARTPGQLNTTNTRHLDGRRNVLPLDRVGGEVIFTATNSASLDGNTVELEREMAKLAENQLAYSALSQMITEKFVKLRTAIQES